MTNEAKISGRPIHGGTPKKKKKKIASLDRRKSRAGWVFVLPFIIGLLLIYIPIIFDSILLSFQDVTINQEGQVVKTFVGWANYREAIMGDVGFAENLWKGLGKLAFDIPAIIIFSLFMAVMLNQKMVGRAAFRAIFFIPVILSTGLMESIESQNIFSDEMESEIENGSGASTASEIVSAMDVERLFANMKIGTGIVDYVTKAINNIYDIVNRSGVQMLIFLAGLQSISPAIYESCSIDGATEWETFWKITFPMISPMILVNGVYTIIDSFTTDSNVVMKYIKNAYSKGEEISTAMSWIYFLIVILIVALGAAIFSAFVFYQRRD